MSDNKKKKKETRIKKVTLDEEEFEIIRVLLILTAAYAMNLGV